MKSTAKQKASAINLERVRTGGGPSTEAGLSASEERVVGLMSNVNYCGISTGFDSADVSRPSLLTSRLSGIKSPGGTDRCLMFS